MVEAAATRKKELERALDNALRNLIERYAPQCVILFGGLARGRCHEWSDIDLCVIKKTDAPFISRMRDASLAADCPLAMDVVVYTPDEWRTMRAQDNYFIRDEIIGAGRVLYGNAD